MALAVLHASARPDINQVKRTGAPTRAEPPAFPDHVFHPSPLSLPVSVLTLLPFIFLYLSLTNDFIYYFAALKIFVKSNHARVTLKNNVINNMIIHVRKMGMIIMSLCVYLVRFFARFMERFHAKRIRFINIFHVLKTHYQSE